MYCSSTLPIFFNVIKTLSGGFHSIFWATVVALEYHVVIETLASCPVSLWLQKRKTLVSTQSHTPFTLNRSFLHFDGQRSCPKGTGARALVVE